jgi:predicted metal-binding membrane protein
VNLFETLVAGFFGDIPGVIVATLAAFVTGVLFRWHADGTRFDLRHVLIDSATDRVSLHKFGQFVALVVSTAVLWYEMMHARLSEWLFTGYMLTWAGTALAKRWIDKPAHTEPAAEPVKESQ